LRPGAYSREGFGGKTPFFGKLFQFAMVFREKNPKTPTKKFLDTLLIETLRCEHPIPLCLA